MRLIDADKLKTHYAWWDDFDHLRETKKDFDTIIDLQPTVEAEPNTAIETVNWYHQNADGEMVLGANSDQQAWFKADDVFEALKADPYLEFCKWVADTVLPEDFEDKWTLGAFAEAACRKLYKLGFVRKDGEYWVKDEGEDDKENA